MSVTWLRQHANFFLFDDLCCHNLLVSISVASVDMIFNPIELLSVPLHVGLFDCGRGILEHLVQLFIFIIKLLLLDLFYLVCVIWQAIKAALNLDALR